MIVLITGLPGSGKTAYAVDMLAHDPQFAGRPKFVMGVPGLKIEHEACPPVEQWVEFRVSPEDDSLQLPYFTFPENAVVFIDEAQRVYRPRPAGAAVPPHVAAFETHRHTGVDFILITQQAGLLDSNIRRLIGRHVHIRPTPMGRYKYEWMELGDPESQSSRQLAASSRYKLPKRAFDLYKSAETHTKLRTPIPWYYWLFAVALLLFFGLVYYIVGRVSSNVKGEPTTQTKPVSSSSVQKSDATEHRYFPGATRNEYVANLTLDYRAFHRLRLNSMQ